MGYLVLFAGGELAPSGTSDVVDVYNTSARSWLAPANLSQRREDLAGSAAGNLVLFAGGQASSAGEQEKPISFMT